jgi:hypothetical protein
MFLTNLARLQKWNGNLTMSSRSLASG